MPDTPEVHSRKEPVNPKDIFLPANVDLHFLFSKHEKAEDVGDPQNFRARIRSSDVVVVESIGWNEAWLNDTRLVAKGKEAAYKHWKDHVSRLSYAGFSLELGSALYNSHTQVVMADYSETDITKEELAEQQRLVGPHEDLLGADFDDAKKRYDAQLQKAADAELDREDFMLSQLGPRLKEVIDPNPKLAKKAEVKVVMILGSGHRRVYDVLEKKYPADQPDKLPRVSEETIRDPLASIYNEMKNLYKSGKIGELDEEAKLRMLTECVGESILMPMRRYSEFSWLTVEKSKEILRQLSAQEIEEMYKSIDRQKGAVKADAPVWSKVRQLGAT